MEKLRAFNEEWNDLPRKLLVIVMLFACLGLLLLALPYVLPFALAALFSWAINPVVTLIARRFGNRKLARAIVTGLLTLLLAGALLTLIFTTLGQAVNEIRSLAQTAPGWINQATQDVTAWLNGPALEDLFGEDVRNVIIRAIGDLTTMLSSLASRLASSAASFAWRAVSLLPQGILFVVLALMGTFYMSSDKDRIVGFLTSLIPQRYKNRSNQVRTSFLRAILSQIRAALIMLCITFTELSVGFLIMGLDYAILLALLIALLDALPVIGAGLFLLPMLVSGIVTGNAVLAVGAGLLYILLIAVRQVMEPRLIGRQLGLYPLATMMAMYAGLRAMGFIGLLAGPLMLMLCKVALTADEARNQQSAAPPPAPEEPPAV